MKLTTTFAVFLMFLTVGCREPSVAPELDPQVAAPSGTVIYLEPGQTLVIGGPTSSRFITVIDSGSVTVPPKEEDNGGK